MEMKKNSQQYSGSHRDWIRDTIIDAIKKHLSKYSPNERLIEISNDKFADIEEDEAKDMLNRLEEEGLLNLVDIRYGDDEFTGFQEKDHYYTMLFGKTYYLIEMRDFFKVKYNKDDEPSGVVPSGTKWQDITIKFIDEHNVNIKIRKKIIKKCDYKEMGFEDKRKRLPNKQWYFLQYLAKNNGICSWDSSSAKPNKDDVRVKELFGGNGYNYKKSPDKKKHIKSKLAKQLKTFFDISEDPFYDYWKEKAYRIKINLIP